ncbi:hypothetical protein [Parasphingorhabdus sp.]|uniref:hypothetical protein n=1 Tax=Parasphingorhabdus sp. TaxID=2709688 RepID=UPI003A93706A
MAGETLLDAMQAMLYGAPPPGVAKPRFIGRADDPCSTAPTRSGAFAYVFLRRNPRLHPARLPSRVRPGEHLKRFTSRSTGLLPRAADRQD